MDPDALDDPSFGFRVSGRTHDAEVDGRAAEAWLWVLFAIWSEE